MGGLREFVADALELSGAVVEPLEPEGLEVLSPEPVSRVMGWGEVARLGFGVERPSGALLLGLEGDWLDRFGALLGEKGRWSERQATPFSMAAPGDPERLVQRALELPNAVARLHKSIKTWTRYLLLTFRYTAVSDEKREGLVQLAFNIGTGSAFNSLLIERLQSALECENDWQAPEPGARSAAGPGWAAQLVQTRVPALLEHRVRADLEPFLKAMQRRLERDRNRVHGYHDDLRKTALRRLAAIDGNKGEKAETERKRETMRVEAIEREYRAKLDDLRHNYALRVTVDWVQTLELYMPVHRFEVEVRRRKSERMVRLDWHPLVRAVEPPVCDWGTGFGKVRLACDEKLHLVEEDGLAPCPSCGKTFCRACHPKACPRCGHPVDGGLARG